MNKASGLSEAPMFWSPPPSPEHKRVGLGKTGVELDDRGYIRVNERLQTTAPGDGQWANMPPCRRAPKQPASNEITPPDSVQCCGVSFRVGEGAFIFQEAVSGRLKIYDCLAARAGYAQHMIKNLFRSMTLSFCFGSMIACAQGPAASAVPKLETEDQKTLYALGLLLGNNIKPFALTPEELTIVKAGLTDAVTNTKPQVELDAYGPKVNAFAQKRAAAGADEAKKKGQQFSDNVAAQKDARKTASGVVIRTITAGAGASPTADDVVKVHYEGKLTDGTVFDSSIKRGQPAEFPLKGVVPCWTEALQQMKKGEKAQIVCPSSAAYGDRGSPPAIPPGATLSFEVELLDFHKP